MKKKRIAQVGKRHRRDDGPAALEVVEMPLPSLSEVGQLHFHTDALIRESPAALLANNDTAKLLAAECGEAFGQDFKAQWTLKTKWLCELTATHRGRVQAEYAMLWRPTFLATVALAHSTDLGCRSATVARGTMQAHREADPDFDAQIIAAQAHCIELLHSVTMRRALEGDIEPVYWQGIRVGFIKKFDGRLQVELLRAHMPQTFKTPGSKVAINTGPNIFGGQNVIFDGPVMQNLQAMRQEALKKLADAPEVGTPALPAVPKTD